MLPSAPIRAWEEKLKIKLAKNRRTDIRAHRDVSLLMTCTLNVRMYVIMLELLTCWCMKGESKISSKLMSCPKSKCPPALSWCILWLPKWFLKCPSMFPNSCAWIADKYLGIRHIPILYVDISKAIRAVPGSNPPFHLIAISYGTTHTPRNSSKKEIILIQYSNRYFR